MNLALDEKRRNLKKFTSLLTTVLQHSVGWHVSKIVLCYAEATTGGVAMSVRAITVSVFLLLGLWSGLYAFQRGRMPWFDEDAPLITPSDAGEKTEYAFARLQYPSYGRVADRIWNHAGNWTIDYPKADRQFVQGVRRLTRIHTRSVEQIVNLDSDEIYNWPWIYAVETGHWELTDRQAEETPRLPAAWWIS